MADENENQIPMELGFTLRPDLEVAFEDVVPLPVHIVLVKFNEPGMFALGLVSRNFERELPHGVRMLALKRLDENDAVESESIFAYELSIAKRLVSKFVSNN